MNSAEQFAEKYFLSYGLQPERFSKVEMRQSKTPDFRVRKRNGLVLYCEAKYVQRDEWLEKQLKNARPLELVGGLRPDPIFNRLSNHIHEAAQQLKSVNPDHTYPNVLLFANSDVHCGFRDLQSVITGNFYAKDGTVDPIYREYSEGRIREEKFIIDAYIWWDDWRPLDRFTRLLMKDFSHAETIDMLLPRAVERRAC
jgi:hypothetical protein